MARIVFTQQLRRFTETPEVSAPVATLRAALDAAFALNPRLRGYVLDEQGHVYLHTELGLGLVHTQDVALAADALERGLWAVQELSASELPRRFGYVMSPQTSRRTAHKKAGQ